MKLPRDLSGPQLIRALRHLGYQVTRQRGSHTRVTTQRDGEHHETIPNHDPIKPGLLASILKGIARHHQISVEALLKLLEL
jgi:predicted RNA binding protein YcfA (HicA-like mRNA interferase family)